MKYKLLSSIYYQDKDSYENVYKERYNSESTYRFDFNIFDNKCFVQLNHEVLSKVERINKLFYELYLEFNSLPSVAKNEYVKKCLIDEVTITNEIEGIVSTRKEINDILENKNTTKRFSDITISYSLIFNKKYDLNSCVDIRNIYNDIVLSDINKEDLPDGELFRKEKVYVRDSRQKNIHIGLTPESEIVSTMNQSLEMLNSTEYNSLIKIAVFHYMFGYIHPFYDGNGRTSRFITTYLLAKEFKGSIASSISKAIASEKNRYYKAFKVSNDKKNKGDLTYFSLNFFDILINGLEEDLRNIVDEKQEFNYYEQFIDTYNNQTKREILYILLQNKIFGEDLLSIMDLVKYSGFSDVNIRSKLAELEELGLVVKSKKSRAYVYDVDLNKIN